MEDLDAAQTVAYVICQPDLPPGSLPNLFPTTVQSSKAIWLGPVRIENVCTWPRAKSIRRNLLAAG